MAKQWASQPNHAQHFFAVLDFADGQAVYQRVSSSPGGPGGAPNTDPLDAA